MVDTVRLAGICYNSLVNGPNMRRVFFFQGCKHNCQGCFNPDTHDFNGGKVFKIADLVKDTVKDTTVKGITLSGGDPVEQSDAAATMAEMFSMLGYNVWCYTGYTFEDLLEMAEEDKNICRLLHSIDVLVDGKFIKELSNKEIHFMKFKGSENQRIINVPESLRTGRVVEMEVH